MSVPLKCMTVHHHPLKVMNQPYRLSVQKGHPIPSFAKLISRAIPLDGHQPPQRPPPLTPMDEVVYFFPLRKKDQKYRHSAPPPLPPMDEVVYFFPLRKKDQTYGTSPPPPPPKSFFSSSLFEKREFFLRNISEFKGCRHCHSLRNNFSRR